MTKNCIRILCHGCRLIFTGICTNMNTYRHRSYILYFTRFLSFTSFSVYDTSMISLIMLRRMISHTHTSYSQSRGGGQLALKPFPLTQQGQNLRTLQFISSKIKLRCLCYSPRNTYIAGEGGGAGSTFSFRDSVCPHPPREQIQTIKKFIVGEVEKNGWLAPPPSRRICYHAYTYAPPTLNILLQFPRNMLDLYI